ncbi:MAG: hypothetical protein IKP67_06600 [Spirochaetales bacterium]|nr:hypothetical protein [Spirochaetales bacterium]
MKISEHFKALKKYVGQRKVEDHTNGLELHRCHFRITENDKSYIYETAQKLHWSMNKLCNIMIEKTLPLVETALFRNEEETDYDVIIEPEKTNISKCPIYMEHVYDVGGYKFNLFAELTRETFLMLQYLKEQLHFYSYCELFRLIVTFFKRHLDLSDIEYGEDKDENNKKLAESVERVRATVGVIAGRLERFRNTPKISRTIVREILDRVRATRACLYPPTQIFLEKMVV